MPQRPDSHVVADIALNRVRMICNQNGWACEVVHNDYGDDLLVQTSLRDEIDHFKIWIQVKGTRKIAKYRGKEGGYYFKVSLDHALKWIRSKDLVLVVLWDVNKDTGYWSIPRDSVDQWDIYSLETEHSNLHFNEKNVFNSKQAEKLCWFARIDHYTSLIVQAIQRDEEIIMASEYVSNLRKHQSHVPLIIIDFLKKINVLDDEYLDSRFLKYYNNARINIKRGEPDIDDDELLRLSSGVAVMGRLNDTAPGNGLTAIMIEICTNVAAEFVKGLDTLNL